ncbi:MAG TPA: cupin domain-containing protein [Phenylobacterium sp.]|uniref:cupin domain-containing protein n=1 Tax=Phenylobacterium sp. TaxID=1871053 RepID=UPI002D379721|nr:cupin domain-containing protein [Phenylobacterium sp.]HZZ69671.1 cupin domain-containing protein [Phenylobacterium sp.]
MADPKHIVRTGGLDWSQVWRGRHPFNPASDMQMVPLGDPAGMSQIGAHLIRIPSGKESFIPHAHTVSEEFVFILEGAGEMVLDGVGHTVGPGDFVGFPIDGVVHSLKSKGPGDLVYLTAGRRDPVEIADMPTIGRTTVFRNGRMELFGEADVERLTHAEWRERTKIGD